MTEEIQIPLSPDSSTIHEARKVWAIAWPLMATNLLNVCVGLVDFKMVGKLGDTSAIAAVGMARTVMMIIFIIMIAIGGGASVLVAHAYGSGDRKQLSSIAAKSVMFMMLAAALIVTPLGLLSSRFLLLSLGGEDRVVELGSQYLQLLFTGSIVFMFNFALSAILIGVGKTRISMVLFISVNLFNILFNYIFIFGMGPIPAFGVAGAALGTLAARVIGSIAGLWILRSPRFSIQIEYRYFLTFDLKLLKKILYLGGPRSLQGVIRNFSRIMILWMISRLPDKTSAVSAYSLAMQVRMFSVFTGLAFMSASMSRVGQNMGAGDPERAEKSGWVASRMAFILMTVASVCFLLFPEQIMSFFTEDRRVISKGIVMFVAIAVTEPLMAMAFALGGALRGGGDAISPFIYGSVADLAVVSLAGYLLAITFNLGFTGIALGLALSAIARTIPTVWKFKKGEWKTNKLLGETA